jgi:pyruvate dehydrogenase E2 component (dihydrolipoamide acetyltransferase)
MADEVKLPRLGQGMESGTIVRWLKSEGDTVQKGEPLFEVDTDKATQEVESELSGVLLAIAVAEGEVPVGRTVALIGEPGEEVSIPDGSESGASSPAREAATPAEPAPEGEETPFRAAINGARDDTTRIKASPLARRMARERGVELAGLTGTGPDGRIIAEDVERAVSGASTTPATPAAVLSAAAELTAAPGEIESVKLTSIRKTIARRLTEAWTVPAFQLTVSADMTQANELIQRSRELDPDARVTVTDLLAKVCARALVRHPDVNVQFAGDSIRRFPSAHIGIAVAAPQGLYVPVIRAVERLSLPEVAAQRAAVVAKARDGALQLADLEGGTFTISNLGMFGIEQFTAVLNPPQAAILAVGATIESAVVVEGELVIRPMMTVTLTVDHRAVDGAPAADFLRTVKTFLEEPALAL